MKLTAKDFEGYNENCQLVKKIKIWIQEQGGSFEIKDLIDEFEEDYKQLKQDIILYIKSEHLDHFLNEFIFKGDRFFIKELLYTKRKIEEKVEKFGSVKTVEELLEKERQLYFKEKSLNKEIEKYQGFSNFQELLQLNQELKKGYNYKKGTVLQVLNYFYEQSIDKSYITINHVMDSVLRELCAVASFEENDFTEIIGRFKFSFWGFRSLEYYYRIMIENRNNSAWKSFEKAINRSPFILKNKRMFEGIQIEVKEENKRTLYRCTGFNEKNKIKFVIDEKDKQKRFSFDNKEFKSFFKDKKVEFLN